MESRLVLWRNSQYVAQLNRGREGEREGRGGREEGEGREGGREGREGGKGGREGGKGGREGQRGGRERRGGTGGREEIERVQKQGFWVYRNVRVRLVPRPNPQLPVALCYPKSYIGTCMDTRLGVM